MVWGSVICDCEVSFCAKDSLDSLVIWIVLFMFMLIVWLFKSVITAVEDADSEDDDDKSSFEKTGKDDDEEGEDEDEVEELDDEDDNNGWANPVDVIWSASFFSWFIGLGSSVIFRVINDASISEFRLILAGERLFNFDTEEPSPKMSVWLLVVDDKFEYVVEFDM